VNYDHLEGKLAVELSMDEVAEKISALNYGTVQLLSSMVRVLRAKQEKFNAKSQEEYSRRATESRSELADGIEALLEKGFYK
jgi:DNA-binding ferritin-like protein